MLFKHEAPKASALPLLKTGGSNAAKIAMTAMTTRSSINVNPPSTRTFSEPLRLRGGISFDSFQLTGIIIAHNRENYKTNWTHSEPKDSFD